MPEPKKDQKVRFQLDLSPSQAARFDQLVLDCDFGSRKELFSTAMTLFNWAVQEVQKGRRVASYDETTDEVEKVHFPALSNLQGAALTGMTALNSQPPKRTAKLDLVTPSGDHVPSR
jgi:hypothetical protein